MWHIIWKDRGKEQEKRKKISEINWARIRKEATKIDNVEMDEWDSKVRLDLQLIGFIICITNDDKQ